MICFTCKRTIQKDFKLCPYCGTEIKLNQTNISNKDLNKKIDKKINNTPKPKPLPHKLMPIDEIFSRLKKAIEVRISWQEKQKELWDYIKNYGVNKSNEMRQIGTNIGKCNYEIHKLINELCQYRVKHSAMKIAYDFLTNEIKRNQKIYGDRVNHTNKVARGEATWIKSSGVTVKNNDESVYEYNEKKKATVSKLMKWRNHVEKFL